MKTSIRTQPTPAVPPFIAGVEAYEPLASRATGFVAAQQPASAPQLVALEDGGVALGLDPSDDLAPHWLAWMEWVDANQPYLV
jgi:hypothetical protein